ncbi:MAG: GatB/YqeY domain-containing protein [Alphaproteobacteria bacterium]|nr:GatB/YqeY domain-containing protein [Alphaproteobacteria bacterium]
MALRDRFSSEMKEAMRAKDSRRLATLRLILAGLKERDIASRSEGGKGEISDDEILSLLAKMVKQREESAAAYVAGARPELAEAEKAEIAVIREFMPQQLSEAETAEAIRAAIFESGAASPKDMGKVMALLKEKFAGRLDMSKAGAQVRSALAGK